MKKILSIVAVAAVMLFCGKANAQLSLHAGYQNYTMSYDTPLGDDSDSDGGFYLGGSYNMAAGAGLGVAPGLYFSYVEDIIDLDIPILVNYKLNINTLGVGVFAGPAVTVGLAGDAYGDDSSFKRFDLGLMFGGQVSYENISLEFGYSLGLLNRWDDAPDDCSVKTSKFFVGVGYSL